MTAAPPYRNEGPDALWHVSEDATLGRFVPRDGKVWAIDTRHLPLYWFPRDCPRATFWATGETSDVDVGSWLGGERDRRVHVIEPARLARMRTTALSAYRMPADSFVPEDGFFVSPTTVDAIERVELHNLVQLHADARIELRLSPRLATPAGGLPASGRKTEPPWAALGLLALWERALETSLDSSGIRLRKAAPA